VSWETQTFKKSLPNLEAGSKGVNFHEVPLMPDLSREEAVTLRFAIVIPAYNHGKQLHEVLDKALRFGFPVFVVDDGSTDSTPQILASFSHVTVIRHEKNLGKGASLLSGFTSALKVADYAITIDADGQHNPDDFPSLFEAVPEGDRPLVVGKRTGMGHENVPWTSRWGRKFSNFWVWASCGKWLSDSQSGFRMYPLPETMSLGARSRRFQFEVEILVRAAWSGIPILEIPVQTVYGPAEERISHFRPFVDFMRNFGVFTKLILMRIFIPSFIRKKL
jgi:glycosyltransferase involved in cell wall biosynthesis